MIPAPFRLERPATLDEAVSLLAADEDAKAIAGGQSLIPLMRLRLAAPGTLVDLSRLEELRGLREAGDGLAIGGLTTYAELERSQLVAARCPLLAETAATVGDLHVRSRGTLGGSLAHGDPKGDLPTAAVALDAQLVLVGPRGERTVPAREFFLGTLTTALDQGELVREVRVPATGPGAAYVKLTRRAQDWALVAAAAVVADGRETIAWTGVSDRPVLAEGDPQAAAERLEPSDEVAGSAAYKRHLAGVLAARAAALARSRV